MIAPPSFTPERNGAYCAPAQTAALESAARAAGLHWYRIDLGGAVSREAVFQAFSAVLAFPAHFGANWDAFADCLEDLSWKPAPGYVVELLAADRCAAALGADWTVVLDILRNAAACWRARRTTFVVLMHGLRHAPAFPA
jgi:hypothetical protein